MRTGILLLAVVALGCGARSNSRADAGGGMDGGAGVDAGDDRYPVDYIRDDCAPDDGHALRLGLYTAGSDCMGDTVGQSVSFYLYEGADSFFPIEAPETVTLPEGAGTHCLGGAAPCLTSTSGEITFDTFVEGVSASGTWSLTFADGTSMSGTFDATWCDGDVLCG